MTIVLVDTKKKLIYTDSLMITGEGIRTEAVKAFYHEGGFLASSGSYSYAKPFLEWLTNSGPWPSEISDKADFIFMSKESTNYFCDGASFSIGDRFFAIGSGARFCLGYLVACPDPERAVRMTAKHVSGCGGEVALYNCNNGMWFNCNGTFWKPALDGPIFVCSCQTKSASLKDHHTTCEFKTKGRIVNG